MKRAAVYCVVVLSMLCGGFVAQRLSDRFQIVSSPIETTSVAVTTHSAVQPSHTIRTTNGGRPPSLRLVVEPQQGMSFASAALSAARRSVDMTMYELQDPSIEGALAQDASHGVKVRVILDRDYAGRSHNQAAYTYLRDHGVSVHWAPSTTIFHQKMFVIDGAVAWIGTGNFTPQYYATSRDFWIRDSKPADVRATEQTFTQDWAGGVPHSGAPTGSDLIWSPGSQASLIHLINSARHSISVESEEMDSYSIEDALKAAAQRGVRVHVVMTQTTSWDRAFAGLVRAGVEVRLLPYTASLYIHAKAMVIDNRRAYVGSVNFSTASMDYNREEGVVTSEHSLVQTVSRVLNRDFASATPFK